MGQEWLGPSYFFISLVLGPLNSLLWYCTFLTVCGVWSQELGSYFLFLEEQIKDIIILFLQEQIKDIIDHRSGRR